MAKCLNCEKYADYVIDHIGADTQTFCDEHLPWHINRKKLPAHVKNITAQPVAAPVVETPVVVEQPEEIKVVEEVVAPKPKAKKKAQNESTTSTDEAGTSSSEDSASS